MFKHNFSFLFLLPSLAFGWGSEYYSIYKHSGGLLNADFSVSGSDYVIKYNNTHSTHWNQKENFLLFIPNGTKEFRLGVQIDGSYKSIDGFMAIDKIPNDDITSDSVSSFVNYLNYTYGAQNNAFSAMESGESIYFLGQVGVEIKAQNLNIENLDKWIVFNTSNKYYCDPEISRRNMPKASIMPQTSSGTTSTTTTTTTTTTTSCPYDLKKGWNLVGTSENLSLQGFLDSCGSTGSTTGSTTSSSGSTSTTTSSSSGGVLPTTSSSSGSYTGSTTSSSGSTSTTCNETTYDAGLTWPVTISYTLDKNYIDSQVSTISPLCANRGDSSNPTSENNESVQKLCTYLASKIGGSQNVAYNGNTFITYSGDPAVDTTAFRSTRNINTREGSQISSLWIYDTTAVAYKGWSSTGSNTLGSTIPAKSGFWVNVK